MFFAIKHEKEYMGGLNENLALNNCESLNHKFMVFSKVALEYYLEKRKKIKIPHFINQLSFEINHLFHLLEDD